MALQAALALACRPGCKPHGYWLAAWPPTTRAKRLGGVGRAWSPKHRWCKDRVVAQII